MPFVNRVTFLVPLMLVNRYTCCDVFNIFVVSNSKKDGIRDQSEFLWVNKKLCIDISKSEQEESNVPNAP